MTQMNRLLAYLIKQQRKAEKEMSLAKDRDVEMLKEGQFIAYYKTIQKIKELQGE